MGRKGEPKTGGRQAGTPNKISKDLKVVLSKILAEPDTEVRLRELRDSYESADRATFWRIASRLVPNAVRAEFEDGVVLFIERRGRSASGGE